MSNHYTVTLIAIIMLFCCQAILCFVPYLRDQIYFAGKGGYNLREAFIYTLANSINHLFSLNSNSAMTFS